MNCRYILEIDLHDCKNLEDESITTLITEGPHLRELRLAHCSRITDNAFLSLPHDGLYESLRILDLTDCGELQDAGVQKIVQAAPRLRNLVLAKCRLLTDRAVLAITRLGKNLHYIHLGHCSRITDTGVEKLVKLCNRIRYIDLACCTNLTDQSVMQLATLPKLKRIGLVKCSNITDRSIAALARPKQIGQSGPVAPSVLERVHLSYCTNLTLSVCNQEPYGLSKV
jgi:F-box and leucine-rich repeat protein GRR1